MYDDADASYPETGQVSPSPSSVGLSYPPEFYGEFPGYVAAGGYVGQDQAYIQPYEVTEAYAWGRSADLTTDPSIGGVPGLALTTPLIFAGVESGTVENFELNGWQADFNRIAVDNYGPAGFGDFAGVLAVSVAAGDFEAPAPAVIQADIATGF